MRHSLPRNRAEHGFTMVELLIVVGLIGILTAIAVPMWLNQRQQAWSTAVQSTVSNASTFIMDNHETLDAPEIYNQGPTTPVDSGIPGFHSTENVELIVYGISTTGTKSFCIEGYHHMNNPLDGAKDEDINTLLKDRNTDLAKEYFSTRWHVTVSPALNPPMAEKMEYVDGIWASTGKQEKLGDILPGGCL